jgi:FMN reductase
MTLTTPPIHIAGLGGTLGRNTINERALFYALEAARAAGATVDLLALRDLDLPVFQPDLRYEETGEGVHRLIEAARRADAMIWSTAVYHGTLAGVTKNALDYLEYLRMDKTPYLSNKPVGLIATAGGDTGSGNAVNAMVHVVQSMHGLAIPRTVCIDRSGRAFDTEGVLIDQSVSDRLAMLGRLVVETAARLRAASQAAILPGGDFDW